MNCTICGKPVVLTPSAKERAAKYRDKTSAEYTALFPAHADCALKQRREGTAELTRKYRAGEMPKGIII